jgi:TolA-binding protein
MAALASCAVEKVVERTAQPGAERQRAEPGNREHFAQAYRLLREGDYEAARPIFADLSRRYPQLADYHLYFGGYIDARVGELAAAETALTQLLAEYPQSVKVDEASLELGKILLGEGESTAAETFLERASVSADRDVGDVARLALAEIAEREGQTMS